MIEVKCQVCKGGFKVRPYRLKIAKYCSHDCYHKDTRGRPTWNKGLKGICCNTGKTHFKKGVSPWNKNKQLRKEGFQIKGNRGYILVYAYNHPYRVYNKVKRSRLVMEKHLGRYLKSEEVVHHRNEIRDDDRIENFILFKNQSEHIKYHWELR